MANSYIKKLHDNLYQYFNYSISENPLYSIVKNPDGSYQLGLSNDDLPNLSHWQCSNLYHIQKLIDISLTDYNKNKAQEVEFIELKQTLLQKLKRFLGVEK